MSIFSEFMKGWKTLTVNVPIATVGGVDVALGLREIADLSETFQNNSTGWAALIMGVLNIYLRFKTTTPVGQKQR